MHGATDAPSDGARHTHRHYRFARRCAPTLGTSGYIRFEKYERLRLDIARILNAECRMLNAEC